MRTESGKFKFTVPEGHAEAGNTVNKTFEYRQVDNDAEAQQVILDKKLSVVALVHDVLKSNARASAYQAALLPYRPSEVPADEIKERMVRDFIRLGVAEEIARKQVESMLAK